MDTIGIVRRIDELGRIVIPKELRRSMRLKEGDEMEIAARGDTIYLRRYSGFESVLSSAKAIAKLLYESTDADVLFVSSTNVLIAEGKNKRNYQDARLDDNFSAIIRKRKTEILHGDELKKVFDGHECDCCYLVVEPVLVNGDLVGAVVLLLASLPSDIARAYLHFCVQLLQASLA